MEIRKFDDRSVHLIAEDGNVMFEVYCGKDGKSIYIRSRNCCRVNKVKYSNAMFVSPKQANSLTIGVHVYDEAEGD